MSGEGAEDLVKVTSWVSVVFFEEKFPCGVVEVFARFAAFSQDGVSHACACERWACFVEECVRAEIVLEDEEGLHFCVCGGE